MNLVFSILLVYSSFAVLDAQVENVTQATPMAVTTIATTTTTLKPRKGVCGMPFVRVKCTDSPFITESFWYNQATNACERKQNFFVKCLFLDNNFETLRMCEDHCVVDLTGSSRNHLMPIYKNAVCSLPFASKEGFREECCPKKYNAWSYNPKTNQCHQFTYGGCGGNDNRFNSKKNCTETCVLKYPRRQSTISFKDQLKHLTKSTKNFFYQNPICRQKFSRRYCYETDYVTFNYWYNKETNKCEKIYSYYISCENGANSFNNIHACERKCKIHN